MTTEEIIHLDFSKNSAPEPKKIGAPSLFLGRKYFILSPEEAPEADHGVVAGYQVTPEFGEIEPFNPGPKATHCFIWDDHNNWCDSDVKLYAHSEKEAFSIKGSRYISNRLIMRDMLMQGPELVERDGQLKLVLSPRFAFEYETGDHDAKLGVITLVRSNRFVNLKEGGQVTLLDTGNAGPVLYLKNPHDHTVVKLINTTQSAEEMQAYIYTHDITQDIYDELDNRRISSFTVLEHYTSYFVHRESDDLDDTIWVPALAPITWGWSIRVERNYDAQWSITRRKLMFPNVGNDGLVLPEWETNTVDCTFL